MLTKKILLYYIIRLPGKKKEIRISLHQNRYIKIMKQGRAAIGRSRVMTCRRRDLNPHEVAPGGF